MLRKQLRIVRIFERRFYHNGSPAIIYNPRRNQGTEFIHVLDPTNRSTATINGCNKYFINCHYNRKFCTQQFQSPIQSPNAIKNESDLKSFLMDLKNNKASLHGNPNFEYSSKPLRGGHIVKQKFEYIYKNLEASQIIKYMKSRQSSRKEVDGNEADKQNNRLITISGSPGIGKSTFLCHFPESKEYREYCKSKESGKSAIVSTLSFNSVMNNQSDCLELRIIYGAIKAMGLVDDFNFDDFIKKFKNNKIDTDESIKFLQELFGADRPILILVDEISKSKDDAKVMIKIGDILDKFAFCDVVVSSLSPHYIEKLVSNSNRLINYAIVYPLLESDLGKKDCELWTNIIISKVGDGLKIDDSKLNLLKSAYLLFSGHPRSIEIMKSIMEEEDKDWSEIAADLTDKDVTFGEFLKKLVYTFEGNKYSDLAGLNSDMLEELVFRHPVTRSAKDTILKEHLEDGDILIYNHRGNHFITCVQLQSLLFFVAEKRLSTFENNNGRLGAAYYFLEDFFSLSGTGIMWEKVISLNIIIQSFENRMTISEIFGINFKKFNNTYDNWKIETNKPLYGRSPTIEESKFFRPMDEKKPGNDGLVILKINGESIYFYLQMKLKLDAIEAKDIQVVKETVVAMISNNLLEHYTRRNVNSNNDDNNNNVHMIFYVWGFNQNKFKSIFSKESFPSKEMKSLVKKQLSKMKKTLKQKNETLPLGFNKDIIINYIEDNWDHFHFVGKDKMETWLCPSFLSFPLLAIALEPKLKK